MKNTSKILLTIIFGIFFTLGGCKKEGDTIATLNTTEITALSYTSISSGGNISSDGGQIVSTRGVCWSTSKNPTINDKKTIDGAGIGIFTSTIIDLLPETIYYFRAYAINSKGVSYGNELTFLIPTKLATLTTTSIVKTSNTSLSSGGNISSDGGSDIIARGVCWSTSTTPTINNKITIDGKGIGAFVSTITGLTPETLYYIRSYAINNKGTSYGNELSFSIPTPVESVSLNASNLTLAIGDISQLIANIKPATAINKNIKWETSNSQVATVSNNGNVTGISIGQATITVTTEDGNFSSSCLINVNYLIKATVTDANNNPLNQATVLAFDPLTNAIFYQKTDVNGYCIISSSITKKTLTILVSHPQYKGIILESQSNDNKLTIKMLDNSYGSVLMRPDSYIPGLVSGVFNFIKDAFGANGTNRYYFYADNISVNNSTIQPVVFDFINSLKLEDTNGTIKTICIPFMNGSTALVNYQPK